MKINSKNPLTLYIKGSLLEVIIGRGGGGQLSIVCVGAQGPRKKLKSCSISVGMPQPTGPRKEVTRREEGMSQRTLRRSRWKEGYEERESVIIGEVSSME